MRLKGLKSKSTDRESIILELPLQLRPPAMPPYYFNFSTCLKFENNPPPSFLTQSTRSMEQKLSALKKVKNDTKTRIFKDLKKRFYCYFLSCSIFIIKATKIKTQIVLFSCDQNCIIAKCSGFIFSRKKR